MIIIKSFIKILSLPLIIVMVLAGLILRLTAHISAYVVGPFLLFILFCAGYSVVMQSWQDVFLPAFIIVHLSHPYMTTGKIIALTRWTFVSKVMSLFCNMLSRFVIAFPALYPQAN